MASCSRTNLPTLSNSISDCGALPPAPPVNQPSSTGPGQGNSFDQLIEATTGRGARVPGATIATERPLFAATPGKTQKDTVKRYLDPASRSPVVLRGYPGTGKTQALLDIAIAHAEQGTWGRRCPPGQQGSGDRTSREPRCPRHVPQQLATQCSIRRNCSQIKAGLTEEDLEAYAATFGQSASTKRRRCGGPLIEFVERLAKPGVERFLADGTGQELYDNSREEFSPASEAVDHSLHAERGHPAAAQSPATHVEFRGDAVRARRVREAARPIEGLRLGFRVPAREVRGVPRHRDRRGRQPPDDCDDPPY